MVSYEKSILDKNLNQTNFDINSFNIWRRYCYF